MIKTWGNLEKKWTHSHQWINTDLIIQIKVIIICLILIPMVLWIICQINSSHKTPMSIIIIVSIMKCSDQVIIIKCVKLVLIFILRMLKIKLGNLKI